MILRSGTTGALALAFTAACGGRGVPVAPLRPGTPLVRYEQTRPMMGGALSIGIVAPDGYDAKAETALSRAFREAERWDAVLTDALARVNEAAGREPVEVSNEVLAAFRRRSAFDEHLVLDERARTVFLPAGATTTFDGVRHGIGTDAAALALKKAGFDDFRVKLEAAAFYAGDAGGEAWEAPLAGTKATVEVRDQAVGTRDGLTVISPDATTAEATVAALVASGATRALPRPLEGALLTTDEGEPALIVTAGLRGRVRKNGWDGKLLWTGEAT